MMYYMLCLNEYFFIIFIHRIINLFIFRFQLFNEKNFIDVFFVGNEVSFSKRYDYFKFSFQ